MPIFFFLFVLMPIVEIALLVKVSDQIGGLNTIALVILTAVMGTYLLKKEGLATLMRFNQRVQQGELPAQEIAAGFALAAGGAMLLTPGFITDAIGFSLVFPLTRAAFGRWLVQRFSGRVHTQFSAGPSHGQAHHHQSHPGAQSQGETLEGEFQRHDEKN